MGGFKKKIDTELAIFFPSQFGTDIQYLDKLREYELLQIRRAMGEKIDTLMLAVANYFLAKQKPHIFNPFDEECVLISSDKAFEDICNSMEDAGAQKVKELTVFEFYSKIAFFEKKVDQLKTKT